MLGAAVSSTSASQKRLHVLFDAVQQPLVLLCWSSTSRAAPPAAAPMLPPLQHLRLRMQLQQQHMPQLQQQLKRLISQLRISGAAAPPSGPDVSAGLFAKYIVRNPPKDGLEGAPTPDNNTTTTTAAGARTAAAPSSNLPPNTQMTILLSNQNISKYMLMFMCRGHQQFDQKNKQQSMPMGYVDSRVQQSAGHTPRKTRMRI